MLKVSRHITLAQARNLEAATDFAHQIGLPFTHFVTILWEQADIVGRVQDVQGKFFERMRKWIDYRGCATAYIWVIERGSEMGLHSHILIHVPEAELEAWRKMLRKWIDGTVTRKVISVRRIGRKRKRRDAKGAVKGAQKYILKGVSNQSASRLRITRKDTGEVMGKRTGTSQNIGPSARRSFINGIGCHVRGVFEAARNIPTVVDTPSARIPSSGTFPELPKIPDFLQRSQKAGRG